MSADKSKAAVFAGWIKDRLPLHQHDRDAIAAELRRLDESEAALLEAMQDAVDALTAAANGGGVNFHAYAKGLQKAIQPAKEARNAR